MWGRWGDREEGGCRTSPTSAKLSIARLGSSTAPASRLFSVRRQGAAWGVGEVWAGAEEEIAPVVNEWITCGTSLTLENKGNPTVVPFRRGEPSA